MKEKQDASITERFTGKGVFPHQWAFTLLIPLRNIFLSPKQLIQRLELKEDACVLEVGPGPGYFSAKVARHLTAGKLFLTDIQQEMLDYAKRRLDKKGLRNVEYHKCDGKTLPFDDKKFDVIYMVTVIGEVENKEAYIKEFYRIMKPDGILSLSEQAGDPDKLSKEQIKELFKDSGFEYYTDYGSDRNFTINFRKR